MKKVLENSIINIDDNFFDNKFELNIPIQSEYIGNIDMRNELVSVKNDAINYKKDYKLWSEVYSPKKELAIFTEIFENAIKSWKKIHISNISLKEEIETVRKLYYDLGYFNKELNCFVLDFENVPITIWVNIKNIIYSFKDYKNLKEKILFVPPPREPQNQKSIIAGINSWVISVITSDDYIADISNFEFLIKEEKINLIRLWNNIYYNLNKIWFFTKEGTIKINLA